METKAKTITEILAAIGGAIASFFCGLPAIIWVLLAVMTIDFITGVICGLMGKSKKTETGGISSSAAFRGLMKKMLIILVVLLAALLDKAVSVGTGIAFEAVAGATCLWFIASEGFSIVENVASMGVPVPKILLQALEIMRQKSDPAEKAEEVKKPKQSEEDKKE
jgi:toxin secretion/phage lysis holin